MAKQQVGKRTKTPAPKELAPDTPRPSRARTSRKAATALPTQEDIATRAYYRYIDRGCTPGFELEDWLSAEAELASQKN